MTLSSTPEPIAWQHIAPDGTERTRTGCIWTQAPSVRGMRAHWVLPDDPRPGEPNAILVVITARVHRCGRARGSGFDRSGGRVIDKGERYAEADERSLTGALAAFGASAHRYRRVIASPNIPPEAFAWFRMFGGGPSQDCHPGTVA